MSEIDELAAAYALHALDEAERARFEAEASPAARAEAAQIADTAAQLGGEWGSDVAPPPWLRASVLDAIAHAPQETAPDASEDADGVTDAAVAADATGAVAPGAAERRARARWGAGSVLGAVAAGAALLLGGVALGTQLGGGSREEALGELVSADDVQRSEAELADGSTATVLWSADRGQAAILFDGLAEAPAGSTYQAWYIDADGPRSVGTFDATGGTTALLLGDELEVDVTVGVTVEPEGGSEAPTTEPILAVET